VPGNDHTITPSPEVDRWYLDYGPLFAALRGRKWVLAPHAVEVAGLAAKANAFVVGEAYIVPVTFGGTAARVTVQARLPGLPVDGSAPVCEVRPPGGDRWLPVACVRREGSWQIDVPLSRGCALVRIAAKR